MNEPLRKWPAMAQNGAVLATTLLTLLIVTMIGMSAMNSSGIQMFLARNTQLKQMSFQNSESTVTIGEKILNRDVSNCLLDRTHCTTNIAPPIISSVDSMDWASVSGPGATRYGKFIVEYLGWRPVPGERDRVMRIYRITGRGLGPDAMAQTRIQTIYQVCAKTDGSACPGRTLEKEN